MKNTNYFPKMKKFKAPVYIDNSDTHNWMGEMQQRTWNLEKFVKEVRS